MKAILHVQFFSMVCTLILLSIPLHAQDTFGPHSPDDKTVLLMHFDSNLNLEGMVTGTASTSNNSEEYGASMDGFQNSFHMRNADSDPGQCIIIPGDQHFNLGNHWTVEMWVKVGQYGSGKSEFPTIFLMDGNGFPSIILGFDHNGNGFTSEVNLQNGSSVSINQYSPVDTNGWYHLALLSDSLNRKISFKIHDESGSLIFSDYRIFPPDSDGHIFFMLKDVLLGGVNGGSNIQFDGWIDELRISNCARITDVQLPPLQLTDGHFEFYCETDQISLWDEVSASASRNLTELCSYWERPGLDLLLDTNEKIKIYIVSRDQLNLFAGQELPLYKKSCYDPVGKAIAIIPDSTGDSVYFGDFQENVQGVLGQLIVKLRCSRDGINYTPPYFMEGFGLYRSGYRPNRDSLLTSLNHLGRLPQISDIQDTSGISTTWKKDLTVSYIEFQLFCGIAYTSLSTWGYETLWHAYLENYYQNSEQTRIRFAHQSDHFDIYAAAQDSAYLQVISDKLEEKLNYYQTAFEMTIGNRFNIVIFPDEATGMACMGYNDFYNGGSGCGGDKLDILSPLHFGGGIQEALKSLVPHEFFHVFHNHMVQDMGLIYGFHAEGMAEFMTYGEETPGYLSFLQAYIASNIESFQNNYGREPNLQDFIANDDGFFSPYTYGQAFWYYMYHNYSDYVTMRQFFNNGLDWNVFPVSYGQIDSGFVNYIKDFAGISSVEETDVTTPWQFELKQNYPNPFNPETLISFTTPQDGWVKLEVFDLIGQNINTLLDKKLNAGRHSVKFSGRDLPGGVYFYRISMGSFQQVKKMILLR